MPRIAGDSSYYSFRLVGPDGPTEFGWDLPSVTSIIKDVLSSGFGPGAGWGQKLAVEAVADATGKTADTVRKWIKDRGMTPNQQRDVRRDEGIEAHDYLEGLCSPVGWSMPSTENPYALGVMKFYEQEVEGKRWTVLDSERPVVSLAGAYSGTLDLRYSAPTTTVGTSRVLDLKTHKPASTSRGYRLEDALQIAAYADAVEEMFGDRVSGGDILLTDANGNYTLEPVEDFERMRQAWRNVLAVFQTINGKGVAL